MVDQRAVDYIKTCLSKGFSLEQIKQVLADAGWPQEELNSAVEFANKGSQDDVNKGKSTKKIFLIGLISLIVFCAVLGVFLYPKEISLTDLQIESISLHTGSGTEIAGRLIKLVSIGENDEITIDVDGVSETIGHLSKKVVNGLEIENIKIENKGIAKIKINVVEPKADGEDNDKKTSQQETEKNNEIDCGNNFDCFIDASENCNPANLKQSLTLDLFGVGQTTSTTYKIVGMELDKCILYLRTDNISLNFPEDIDLSQEEIDEQNEMYDALEGRNGTCKFETKDLTEMLKRWKEGNFSSGEVSCSFKSEGKTECTTKGGDFGVAECQGTYFVIDLCIDDGKCPPGCTAETDGDC